MIKNILLILLLIVSNVIQAKETEQTLPSWEMADVNGNTHKFPESNNKTTLVLFWATWCPFCKKLMPHIQSILYQYAEELDLQVYAMNIFEDDDAKKYLDDNGYDFLLFPKAEEVAKLYGVQGTPALFIFDQDGKLIFDLRNVNLERIRINRKASNSEKALQVAPLWAAKARQALIKYVKK